MTTLGDFKATAIDGTETDLAAYEGQVVLVVNTASQCGFTPQYKGLQELQDTYGDRGFTVLGFPCDQFGGQEPGAEDDLDEEDYWEQPDQANDASVPDWRLDPFVGCNICFEQKSVEDVWDAPCQHIHCNVCLEILVRSWYTSTRAPKCCDAVLAWEDFKHQIDPELVAAIDAKREELDSNNRIYCSERTCSTFIGAQDISGDTATCSACQKQTCTSCKATSHTGGCVPDASISNELEHAEQEGWKRCGQCQMVVERVDGCPHMT